jgi:hypothetical protein
MQLTSFKRRSKSTLLELGKSLGERQVWKMGKSDLSV